jgi:Tol biopolymer transport system component
MTSRHPRRALPLAAALTALLLPAAALTSTPTSSAAPTAAPTTAASGATTSARAAISQPRVSPRRPMARERTTYAGDLPGGKRPVTLQRKAGGSWKTVTRARTSASGGYRLTTRGKAGTYRVTAPATGGQRTSTTRPVRTRLARQSVRLVDVPSPLVLGLPRPALVDVAPARRQRTVVLQRRQGPRWVDLATARTDAAGTARITYDPSEVPPRDFRVTARPYRGARAATSEVVRLRTVDQVERVSVGLPPGGEAYEPSVTSDGSLVAFTTRDPLVPEDADAVDDVYLFDRRTGELSLAVPSAEGIVNGGALSATGRYLLFQSLAGNLVGGETGGSDYDVFVLDRRDGSISLVSRTPGGEPGGGNSYAAAISADGRFVAFTSTADDLVGVNPPPNTSVRHAYVRDRSTGTTRPLDRKGLGWSTANVFGIDLSADGSRVVFSANDLDLDPGNVNGSAVYAFDIASDGTLSARTNVTPGTNGNGPLLSGDGRVIAFTSTNDLDPDDNDGELDGYLVLPDGDIVAAGPVGDGESRVLDLSRTGRWLAIGTRALVPGDTNGDDRDVVVLDTVRSTFDFVTRSGPGSSSEASLSADAEVVGLGSVAPLGAGAVGEYEVYAAVVR